MRYRTLKILILASILAFPGISIADESVDFDPPRPLQLQNVDETNTDWGWMFANDLVAILHTLIPEGTENFTFDTIEVEKDGEIVTVIVPDFALSPGMRGAIDTEFFTPNGKIGNYNLSDVAFPGDQSREVYFADVRQRINAESSVYLDESVIYINRYLSKVLSPYDNPPPDNAANAFANLPGTVQAPAYFMTKIQNSNGRTDIALIAHDHFRLQVPADGGGTEAKIYTSPLFYLQEQADGFYRLAGIWVRELDDPKRNIRAIDIEALDIDDDGIQDLAVTNWGTEDSYVLFLKRTAEEWDDINVALEPHGPYKFYLDEATKMPRGVYDSTVITDRVEGGQKDKLLVTPFHEKFGVYWGFIFDDMSNPEPISLGLPFVSCMQQFLGECMFDEDGVEKNTCGPVRAEGTRYLEDPKLVAEDVNTAKFDLNNDGCGDFITTFGHLDIGENEANFNLFPCYVLYMSEKQGEFCQSIYEVKDEYLPIAGVLQEKYKDVNDVAPRLESYAIEITNLNPQVDSCPDIIIGLQNPLVNHDGEPDPNHADFDTLAYIRLNKEIDDTCNIFGWDIFADNKEFYVDANYRTKGNYYIEDKPGGGVKAIKGGLGQLGIINGYPFVAYDKDDVVNVVDLCPQLPLDQVKDVDGDGIGDVCECGRDMDGDNWGDLLPDDPSVTLDETHYVYIDVNENDTYDSGIDLVMGNDDGQTYIDEDGDGFLAGGEIYAPVEEIFPNCDTCAPVVEFAYQTLCDNIPPPPNPDYTDCKNTNKQEIPIPEGCLEHEPEVDLCPSGPNMGCPSGSGVYSNFDEAETYTPKNNEYNVDNDCYPDCAIKPVPMYPFGTVYVPCDDDIDPDLDGKQQALCGCERTLEPYLEILGIDEMDPGNIPCETAQTFETPAPGLIWNIDEDEDQDCIRDCLPKVAQDGSSYLATCDSSVNDQVKICDINVIGPIIIPGLFQEVTCGDGETYMYAIGTQLMDSDEDGIPNFIPGQPKAICDYCPFLDVGGVLDQQDADGDKIGDPCDTCPGEYAGCANCMDYCAGGVKLKTGKDSDGDSIDDACDPSAHDSNIKICDNCQGFGCMPKIVFDTDEDDDNVPDQCETEPNNPAVTTCLEPAITCQGYGCAILSLFEFTDNDDDGMADQCEEYPDDGEKTDCKNINCKTAYKCVQNVTGSSINTDNDPMADICEDNSGIGDPDIHFCKSIQCKDYGCKEPIGVWPVYGNDTDSDGLPNDCDQDSLDPDNTTCKYGPISLLDRVEQILTHTVAMIGSAFIRDAHAASTPTKSEATVLINKAVGKTPPGQGDECQVDAECVDFPDQNACQKTVCNDQIAPKKCDLENIPAPDCCLTDDQCDDADNCTDNACVDNLCVFTDNPAIEGCGEQAECNVAADCNDDNNCTNDACNAENKCTHTFDATIPGCSGGGGDDDDKPKDKGPIYNHCRVDVDRDDRLAEVKAGTKRPEQGDAFRLAVQAINDELRDMMKDESIGFKGIDLTFAGYYSRYEIETVQENFPGMLSKDTPLGKSPKSMKAGTTINNMQILGNIGQSSGPDMRYNYRAMQYRPVYSRVLVRPKAPIHVFPTVQEAEKLGIEAVMKSLVPKSEQETTAAEGPPVPSIVNSDWSKFEMNDSTEFSFSVVEGATTSIVGADLANISKARSIIRGLAPENACEWAIGDCTDPKPLEEENVEVLKENLRAVLKFIDESGLPRTCSTILPLLKDQGPWGTRGATGYQILTWKFGDPPPEADVVSNLKAMGASGLKGISESEKETYLSNTPYVDLRMITAMTETRGSGCGCIINGKNAFVSSAAAYIIFFGLLASLKLAAVVIKRRRRKE